MSYWGNYKPYLSVAEKKRIAQKKLAKLRQKNPNIEPIVVEGRKLVSNWWGKAWNNNLESYADYSNRLGRGRSCLCHGSVLDLKIISGAINALVQGSETYKVTVKIEPLSKDKWHNIQTSCQGKFESLQALLDGKFPKDLSGIFTNRTTGLFPSPSEISFHCNCPDWADMCKHIAAVLYGIGVRLDSEPSLFFTLRNVKMDDLISKIIDEKKLSFLEKAKQKSKRVIADSNLSVLFGIEMDEVNSTIIIPARKKAKRSKKDL